MKPATLLASLALGVFSQASADPAPSTSATHTAHWQADLDYFAQALPAGQKEFYQLIPKDKFDREVAGLKRAVPQLSDAEIILELSRVVASLGVAHSRRR